MLVVALLTSKDFLEPTTKLGRKEKALMKHDEGLRNRPQDTNSESAIKHEEEINFLWSIILAIVTCKTYSR